MHAILLALLALAQPQDDRGLALINSDANPLRSVPDTFEGGNYLAPLRLLEREAPGISDPLLRSMLDQMEAQYLSYVGDVLGAQAAFERQGGTPDPLDEQALAGLLDGTEQADAVQAVLRLARDRRFVVINEAHHLPHTRMLTAALLAPLWEAGFRYLALEAIDPGEVDAFHVAGRPLQGRGGYLSEPVFADLVRQALDLGFRLVAYEDRQHCMGDPEDPMHCINLREENQARNLLRVLDEDPDARVLVHCGYAHLDERQSNGWKHMAEWLAELTNEDPLTVDQTRMRAHSLTASESPYYQHVAEWLREPSVFVREDGTAWVEPARRDRHDVTVFLPRIELEASRPDFLGWYGRRRAVVVNERPIGDVALLQAFVRVKDNLAGEVPVDQFLVPEAGPWTFFLPDGAYVLRALDADGEALAGWGPKLSVGAEGEAASALRSALQGGWRSRNGTLLAFDGDRCVLARDGRQTVFNVAWAEASATRSRAYTGQPTGDLLRVEGGALLIEHPGAGEPERYERLEVLPASLSLAPLEFGAREPDPEEREDLLAELAERMALDQDIRNELQRIMGPGGGAGQGPEVQALLEEMAAIDDENTERVVELIDDIGWISLERFGSDANMAAFLIVQHSGNLRLMRAVLPLVEDEARGAPQLSQLYALLYDRTMLALGEKQRYGTQGFSGPDGKTIIGRLEDPAGVDERRASLGMGPLADYARLLGAELPGD